MSRAKKGAPSDIDPERVDAGAGRKRRKQRNKPDPHPALKASKAKAAARAERRAPTPAVMLEHDGEAWVYESPHNDRDLFELQIADTFGTRSLAVMRTFLSHLRQLCRDDWDASLGQWKANETELSAALAMVADIAPKNTTEAALAAQMVAVHWMQMRLSEQALNNGGMVLEREAGLAAKLARTYAIQLETLRGMRGGRRPTARQAIKVEKTLRHEVHYHMHTQGEGEAGEQPHEPRTATVEGRAQVQGSCEIHRLPMPSSSDAGKEGLPQARRSKSGRSDR